MIDVILTPEHLNKAQEFNAEIKRRADSLGASSLFRKSDHYKSICSQMAWAHVLGETINSPVHNMILSGHDLRESVKIRGCIIRTTDHDYRNALVRKEHDSNAYVVTAIFNEPNVRFIQYVRAGDAQKPENFCENLPYPAYITNDIHPIEELVEKLKKEKS